MRKRIRVLILAAVVAAVVVPVGFALSLDSGVIVHNASRSSVVVASSSAAPMSSPILLGTRRDEAPVLSTIPDGAKLFLVGTMLFGLAAVVRKAS
jgi:hypothetical protein